MITPTDHTSLINYIIEKYGLRSYLEIGVQGRVNFDKVTVKFKEGIDPDVYGQDDVTQMTSDEFFSGHKIARYDIIFIDGLHESHQVKRDFENSLKCLNRWGYLVIHDTVPPNEESTLIPRQTKQWCGDVYKFASTLNTYPDIDFKTFNFDFGCTVVWKTTIDKSEPHRQLITWDEFQKEKETLLRFNNDLP